MTLKYPSVMQDILWSMDMLMKVMHHSWPMLPYGVVGSHLADHAKAVLPQLYGGCMTRIKNVAQRPSIPPQPFICTILH